MARVAGKGRRGGWAAIAGSYVLLFCLFAAVLIRFPRNFFADDSYFYFQVAWNIARGMGSTFNGLMPTNGYHPLWMLCCVAVFKLAHGKLAALHLIALLIALFDAATCLLLFGLLQRVANGFSSLAFVLFVPFCMLSQLGTEGALSGCLLVAMAWASLRLATEPDAGRGFAFALCTSLAVLGRLDNIFVVSLLWLALFGFPPREQAGAVRRQMLLWAPVNVLLWGAYVGSNLRWFGTVQPISGMLKAHSRPEHKTFASLPHTAWIAVAIIVPCLLVVGTLRRDRFFRLVEVPWALGVLLHGLYIWFVMSGETRWTWYYTSWILLASLLLSRAASALLGRRGDAVRLTLAAAGALVLLSIWVRGSYSKNAHTIETLTGDGLQAQYSDRLHLHTVLMYDQPGLMAYFTDLHVVALDGLMGDLKFQHDLGARGIAWFDREHQVDAIFGPGLPIDAATAQFTCGHIYLSSVEFQCVPDGSASFRPDSVEVFARLDGRSAGTLPLPADQILPTPNRFLTVWRLPTARAGVPVDSAAAAALPPKPWPEM